MDLSLYLIHQYAGFTKNTRTSESLFKDASNKTKSKFLFQLVCKLQRVKHGKANLVKTSHILLERFLIFKSLFNISKDFYENEYNPIKY